MTRAFQRAIAPRTDLRHVDEATADTAFSQVTTAARRCGASFTAERTPPVDLPGLFALALAEQNDTLARAVADRRVALAKTAAERDSVYSAIIREELNARPVRFAEAEAVLERTPHGATGMSLLTRVQLVGQLLAVARDRMDRTRMQSYATRILALARDLSAADFERASTGLARRNPIAPSVPLAPVLSAYESFVVLAYLSDRADSVAAILYAGYERLHTVSFRTQQSESRVVEDFAPLGLTLPGTETRATVPAAEFWFPTKPTVGRVTVLVSLSGMGDAEHTRSLGSWDFGIRDTLGMFVYNSWDLGARLPAPFDRVRQWMADYGARGLSVVTPVQLGGEILRRNGNSRQQAERLGWFFRDYLQLPITVGVTAPASGVVLKHDGTDCGFLFGTECHPYLANPITIVDRGTLLYSGDDAALADLVLTKTFAR